jgi:hypothetical protein
MVREMRNLLHLDDVKLRDFLIDKGFFTHRFLDVRIYVVPQFVSCLQGTGLDKKLLLGLINQAIHYHVKQFYLALKLSLEAFDSIIQFMG